MRTGRRGHYPAGMLQDAQALAVRRALLAAAALAATVAAHHAATGHTALYAATPALWLGLLAAATLVGRRARPFRPRGPVAAAATLAAAQLAAHVVLTQAPWALGLAGHADVPVFTPEAVVAHAAAALVLALVLAGADAALGILCGAVHRLTAALRGARRGAARPAEPVPAAARGRVGRTALPVRASRGPPLPVVA